MLLLGKDRMEEVQEIVYLGRLLKEEGGVYEIEEGWNELERV